MGSHVKELSVMLLCETFIALALWHLVTLHLSTLGPQAPWNINFVAPCESTTLLYALIKWSCGGSHTRGMSPTPIIRMWVVRTMRTLRGWNQWRHSWLFPLCQLPLFFNMKEIKGMFYTLHHLYDDFYTSSMATSKWLPLRLFTHQLHIKVPQTKVGLLLAKDANVSTNNAKLGFIVQIFFTILIHGLWIMHGVGPHLETCSCYNSMNITPFLPKWTQTWRRFLFTTSPPKVHSYWSTLPHFIHQLCPFKFLHIK